MSSIRYKYQLEFLIEFLSLEDDYIFGFLMSKNSFHAMNWLSTRSRSATSLERTIGTKNSELPKQFNPSTHLTPGWEGDSLRSKEGSKIKKAFLLLWKDAIFQILQLKKANLSLQKLVFEQFLNFNKTYANKDPFIKSLDDLDLFWGEVSKPAKTRSKSVDKFIKSFSFKAVCLYLYKIKLLGKLSDSIDLILTEQEIQNPNFTLNKIFKRGSENQINTEALQKNCFSWFNPSSHNRVKLQPLLKAISRLSITEFMKITSVDNYIDDLKQNYSHSFSHKSFGILLNELLVSLPVWFDKNEELTQTTKPKATVPISTKFLGDQMASICQSHWLAQGQNLSKNWKYVLCPDFRQLDDKDKYLKLSHELQFLCFLCDFSLKINQSTVSFIAYILNSRFSKTENFSPRQTSLFGFDQEDQQLSPSYDRLVINLINSPKKNPHHYLVNKITEQLNQVNENGYIYVFTNQRLFVPSQTDRTKILLDQLDLKVEINFEDLKGKGEIQDHLFIFKKPTKKNFLSQAAANRKEKKTFTSFKWSGDLTQFNLLNSFSKELFECFESKHPSTPLYLKEISSSTIFKLNQEIILEGKLLNQSTGNDDQITHPSFMKNLTAKTKPLDHFFKIETIEDQPTEQVNNSLLFKNLSSAEDLYNYVLIVHLPDGNAEKVEIIPSTSYLAKKQNYGVAYHQYFGLIPKLSGLNINIFREFFNSPIGKQIIMITLTGGLRKVKSRVSSLLVPSYFEHSTPNQPGFDNSRYSLLTCSAEDFYITSLPEVNTLETLVTELESSLRTSPGMLLNILSNLKVNTKNKSDRISLHFNDRINLNFRSVELQKKLTDLNLFHLHNESEDVYIEFLVQNKSLLQRPLESIEMTDENKEELETSIITIYSSGTPFLKIHTGRDLANLIHFLFNNYIGYPIDQLVKSLKVPSLKDLTKISNDLREQQDRSTFLYDLSVKKINQLITKQVISH